MKSTCTISELACTGSLIWPFGIGLFIGRAGWERIIPATDRRSPQVESDWVLENDRLVWLKLTKDDDERRRTKRHQIWLEESETLLI